jgi:hypothetical protein
MRYLSAFYHEEGTTEGSLCKRGFNFCKDVEEAPCAVLDKISFLCYTESAFFIGGSR